MRTQKQIKEELKKYEKIETFPYHLNPKPYDEWMQQRDLGYRDALQWVLEIKDEETTL